MVLRYESSTDIERLVWRSLQLSSEETSTILPERELRRSVKVTYVKSQPIVTEKLLSRDPLTDLRRAFKLFDVDGTGVINLRDLRRVAKELGENLGEEEL